MNILAAELDALSRSPQRADKTIGTIDDIDEEGEEIDKKVSRQIAATGYSESHRFTSDLFESVDTMEPTHIHSNHATAAAVAAVEPMEETRR